MKITTKNSHYIDNREKSQSFKSVPTAPIYLPEITGKAAKVVGNYVRAPEQKLLLATTALIFQPLIDLKYAEEDKKVDSAIKSASKAMAGGITGVTIRALFTAWTKKNIVFDARNKNFLNEYFYPDNITNLLKTRPRIARRELDSYNRSLALIFATLFMIIFSNSKLDVPLTSDFQDILGGVIKEKKNWARAIGDVGKNRQKIITDWLMKHYRRLEKVASKGKRIVDILFEDTNKEKKEVDK